jgi:1-acyl-sn-glycerol-3-phosphate acyltransferase
VSFYRFVRAVVLSLCKVAFRVRVVGRCNVPRRGVYVLAPSHRSILDIPFAAFATRRRLRFMAKEEIFASRLGRAFFGALGAIRVERGTADRSALRASQAALEDGEPLAVFPEGTRNNGPTLGPLHDGAAYLASKLGVPIIPVGIGGSEEILASGRSIPRIHKVVVVIGEPIVPVTDGTRRRSAVRALTEELRVRLQGCFDEALAAAGVSAPLVHERGEGS